MDPLTGLATLKTASELATGLRDALKSRDVKLDEVAARLIEIQDLIVDGRGALIEAQEQLIGKSEELADLRRQVVEFQAAIREKEALKYLHGAYWRTFEVDKGETDPDGNSYVEIRYDGPFCPTCNDADGKAVRLRLLADQEPGLGQCCCDVHHIDFSVPKLQE
jgi:hypothetical protein